jgi:hypothetical protein
LYGPVTSGVYDITRFENYLKKMGVEWLQKVAKNRDSWKLMLKDVRVLPGP